MAPQSLSLIALEYSNPDTIAKASSLFFEKKFWDRNNGYNGTHAKFARQYES